MVVCLQECTQRSLLLSIRWSNYLLPHIESFRNLRIILHNPMEGFPAESSQENRPQSTCLLPGWSFVGRHYPPCPELALRAACVFWPTIKTSHLGSDKAKWREGSHSSLIQKFQRLPNTSRLSWLKATSPSLSLGSLIAAFSLCYRLWNAHQCNLLFTIKIDPPSIRPFGNLFSPQGIEDSLIS